MPLNFKVFCNKCGSYDININAEIVEESEQVKFYCKNCDIVEQFIEQ